MKEKKLASTIINYSLNVKENEKFSKRTCKRNSK